MEPLTMTSMKQNMQFILLGVAIVIATVSASYLLLNTRQQPETCTMNQTPGEVIIIDDTMDNAVICTKPDNSVTLRLRLWDRVGGEWAVRNSSGLLVSDGIRNMPDRNMPGFGTITWNVTTMAPGVQNLKAECKRGGDDKLISSQNLTFVVR